MTERSALIALLAAPMRRCVYDEATRCWAWTGAVTGTGYPVVKRNGKHVMLHRQVLQAGGVDLTGPHGKGGRLVRHRLLRRWLNCSTKENQ